ncbi:MAG TPA: glucose 1-dehydrogenase [Acidimicrobiales bacterium]|jgi:2-hydroxycyclohexanecarboxyl-CoA dehydrogenase|nr:glucose 1-dehydrogenase [Acidimicrobiales bacterium]
MTDLGDRVAVVTGGAGGIGSAIAHALFEAGAAVAVWDVDGGRAKEVGDALGDRAVGVEVDITSRASIQHALDSTQDWLGPVDVLVNNAGIDKIERFLDSEESTWERVVAVNYLGTVRCCHVVLPGMVERNGGRVINIASDAGRVGSSGEVVYSGTKGGIIAFSKALAREVAANGVTVNVVCPGPTDTPLLDLVAEASQKLYDSLARAVPMKRIGQPADIAPAVAFLASDGAAYITGQTLSVSGGLTMA